MDFSPFSGIAKEVMGGLGDLFTSDEERVRAQTELEKVLQQPHILQAMANIEEAKHRSLWVAGWRPSIGWICALGLGYQFLILPFAALISAYIAPEIVLPALEAGELMTLVLSLLGLGGLRTYEKQKGLTK